jgi:hypothetical protein
VLGAERIMVGRLSGSGRDGKTAQIVDRWGCGDLGAGKNLPPFAGGPEMGHS